MDGTTIGKKGFRPYVGLTALIGFGFFTMGLMDMLYDICVPVFLGTYIESKTIIQIVMTLDNALQILLIPILAAWSDRTRTPMGRRMPFIVTMLPAAAVFFSLVPYAWGSSLAALIAVLFFLNVFKTGVRGPVVALMPDTIPGEFRSEANGVINTMGGIGGIVSSLVLGKFLLDLDIVLPVIGRTRNTLSFVVAGVLVIVAVVVLLLFVRERHRDESAAEEKVPLVASLKAVFSSEDNSALLILVSIFLWFSAHEGVKPLLSLYSTDVLGQTLGGASLPMAISGVAYALCAIPAGLIAHRFGRRKVIRVSLVAMLAVFAVISILAAIGPAPDADFAPKAAATGLIPRGALYWIVTGLMGLYGVFWGSVITNSFPMLWQMSTFGNIGMFTGLYYIASQSASIAAPPLTGAITDVLGLVFGADSSGSYAGSFVFSAICVALALVVMGKVRKGEPGDRSIEVAA